MTMARSHLVDVSVTRWYHCITGCVRRAFLLAEGPDNRKEWIERRLEELAEIFAVSVGGFSVMDNHMHVLIRLDPDTASSWSDEEVVRRWGRLFPPRDKSRQPLPVSKAWVEWRLQDVQWLATARARLQSLSWFMKCLKEPLARLANRQDNTRGAFFEERFKSVAILDEESLLATCAYIDLNPVAAGIVELPEASPHTSILTRVELVKEQGRTSGLSAAPRSAVVWQDRPHPRGWRNPSGCARLKIDESWIRRVKECWKGSHLEATCSWSITRADFSETARRRFQPSYQEFSIAWAAAPRAGKRGLENSRAAACSAGSSPRVENVCEKWRGAWACITWRTWAVVPRGEAGVSGSFIPGRHDTQRLPKLISRQGFADNPSVPPIKAFCVEKANSGTASLAALL